jgi:hypothetical protein
MEGVRTVETNRLVLRHWCEEDGVEFQRLFNDPAVREGELCLRTELPTSPKRACDNGA